MNREHSGPDDADVVRRLHDLPRTTPIDPAGADRVVAQLEREGFFRRRQPWMTWGMRAAAALLLFTLGAFAGTRYARANSLDAQLSRHDLPASQRVLLLQRAGSDYVRAAELAPLDSTAAQVARQTLLGAASAMARTSLETHVSAQLATLFTPPPVIWF